MSQVTGGRHCASCERVVHDLTDATEDEARTRLGPARAKAIAKRLKDAGIDPSRLLVKGYGATKPIDSPLTVEGRARNRRVTFHVLWEGDGEPPPG